MRRGVTLVEVLVGITLSLGVLGALVEIGRMVSMRATSREAQVEGLVQGRRALDLMRRGLRDAAGYEISDEGRKLAYVTPVDGAEVSWDRAAGRLIVRDQASPDGRDLIAKDVLAFAVRQPDPGLVLIELRVRTGGGALPVVEQLLSDEVHVSALTLGGRLSGAWPRVRR